MKNKVVRLPHLNRLRVSTGNSNQGVGPCALEFTAVLDCWSNTGDGATADVPECREFVARLASCMRSYVRSCCQPENLLELSENRSIDVLLSTITCNLSFSSVLLIPGADSARHDNWEHGRHIVSRLTPRAFGLPMNDTVAF